MSWWGSLQATFRVTSPYVTAEAVLRDVPTGSESGPQAELWKPGGLVEREHHEVHVDGRLRDVNDTEDSPAVLAWFVKACRWTDHADLLWELDQGPRYRYEWRDGVLSKLKGVLDQ